MRTTAVTASLGGQFAQPGGDFARVLTDEEAIEGIDGSGGGVGHEVSPYTQVLLCCDVLFLPMVSMMEDDAAQ